MEAVEEAKERQAAATPVAVLGAVSGVYVQFESIPGFGLELTSLDPQRGRNHPELRAVTSTVIDDQVVQLATVFVPDGQLSYFTTRFEQYATENTPNGNPKNKQLVERISDIRVATVRALWTDDPSHFPAADQAVWWEVWMRRREGAEQHLAPFASAAGVELGTRRLVFEDRVVLLLRGTPEALGGALDVLDDIAELRRPADPMQFLADLSAADQADFIRDLTDRVVVPGPDAPAVCVLDTGISQAHPLIAVALDSDDCHTCHTGTGREDRNGHGTKMAGLALLGDVGEALGSSLPVRVRHRLESVQILPDAGTNPPQLYGAITAQAASLVEIAAPTRTRSFALAVTAEATTGADSEAGTNLGAPRPTSWSAALDALAAGRAVDVTDDGLVDLDHGDERTPRLFLVSAGNVRSPELDHLTRSDLEPVEDPGQAWNVLTVGAFTNLVDLSHEQTRFPGWEPLAPPGELSPFSRTSVGFKPSWPLKPEVVFEGGNAAVDPVSKAIDTPGGLQVLTTQSLFRGRGMLTTTAGTSPATAQAAHMAASISATYPSLWPETVRALIVHAARWTERMAPEGNSRAAQVRAVRRYGWGVPALDRALRSANDAVTLIAQNTIHPYSAGGMRELHLHELPWPTQELQDLGQQQVKLRVALSYFIEPNPARRGWVRRFQYQSHGLRFDLRRATESNDDLRRRLNRFAEAEDERRPVSDSDATEWLLGPRERVRGSLHVDLWTGSAADLAARGMIAVYPVGGWWKEQPKRDRSASGVRYSLVISIEAPDVEVDLWTPVAIAADVPITTVVET